MGKLKKDKKAWLCVFFASILLSVLGIALSVLFSLKLYYVPLGLALVFAIQGFYLAPFAFIAYANRKRLKNIILLFSVGGLKNAADIAGLLLINPEYVRKMLSLAKKKRYI